MSAPLSLSQAVFGFRTHLESAHRSPHTINDYMTTLRKLMAFVPPATPITAIDADTVRAFLAAQTAVKKKTVLNYHIGLSAFWTFLVENDYAPTHVIHAVSRPRPEKNVIQPLTPDEINAMFRSLKQSLPYLRPGKTLTAHSIAPEIAHRNRTLLLVLLDTGLRVSELCDLRVADYSHPNSTLKVTGKGDKQRILYLSPRTNLALWKYVASRSDCFPHRPLFATELGTPFTRRYVAKLLERIAVRANVPGVHPHRFRHTFAIMYLRNGGDIFTLQSILGHASLDMVRKYLAIAQVDVAAAHRLASPVDHLSL